MSFLNRLGQIQQMKNYGLHYTAFLYAPLKTKKKKKEKSYISVHSKAPTLQPSQLPKSNKTFFCKLNWLEARKYYSAFEDKSGQNVR